MPAKKAAAKPAKSTTKAPAKAAAKPSPKTAAKAPAKPSAKGAAAKPVAKSPVKPVPKAAKAGLPVKSGASSNGAAKGVAPKVVTPTVSAPKASGAKAAAATTTETAPKVPVKAPTKGPAKRDTGVMATFVVRNPRPVNPPATDGEDGEDANLLAGPRNVQPYIAKRGEQYMSREQLTHFRAILESWKRDLMREVDRTVSHMKDEAANFPDPNDRATQEEEFSLELRTRDRERKLIRKIEEALERIEDGSYGYCLETGEEIGIKRLEARPVATLSLEAQERRERREKQYGERDDRYR